MVRYSLFAILLVIGLFSCKKNDSVQQQQGITGSNLQCRVQSISREGNVRHRYTYDTQGRLIEYEDFGYSRYNFQYSGDSVFMLVDGSPYLTEVVNADGNPKQLIAGNTFVEFSYTASGELQRVEMADLSYRNDPYNILTDIVYNNGDIVSYTALMHQGQLATSPPDTVFNELTYLTDLYYEYDPVIMYVEYGFILNRLPVYLFNTQIFSKHFMDTWTWNTDERETDFDYVLNAQGRAESVDIDDNALGDFDRAFTYDCY